MSMATWQDRLQDVLPKAKELRRHLHRHPELSGKEINTQKLVIRELEALGIEVHTFRDCYGVMGILRNGEGCCVAIRADMDALPVQEPEGLPFASENSGVMHACGHDVHTALALGSAMWLSRNKDQWQGTVKFFFEPAEESFGGSRLMVEQGCLENPKVDCVIGQHVNPRYEAGTFFAKPGYVSGSSDELRIRITGKTCHGAYPEAGVDAIVIAGQVVSALQTLVSRTISPFENAVISIGTIQGGTANNIICGEVNMVGTMRTLSVETRAALKERIGSVVKGVAQAMGGDGEVTINPGYGAVYNDDGYYARIESLARELVGSDKIIRREAPSLGVESFCYFLKDTPGVYYDLGSGVGTALHTATFMVDEDCLLPGVALQCASVLELLKEE
ncbi:MAG: amidohydrolase [Clostridia bacterium]|nr:amidohydrolase [Clostridia bacterium]